MARHLNLRQIEAFKAVIENGTISRAADMMHVSQPAMSKLIGHLEFDTGLRLFDRVRGRLAPTAHGMRLYEEVGRIFAGVRQVESAVDAIRRESQGRLAIGVLPALTDTFIQRATAEFIQDHPNVFCSVHTLSSEWVVDWLIARKLDVGLVSARMDNPNVVLEPIMQLPLACILPTGHPLSAKHCVEAKDLDGVPFVAFDSGIYLSHLVADALTGHDVVPRVVMMANHASSVCEFVAAGLGVSLVHPVMLSGERRKLTVRRFEPEITYSFQLCRSADSRNAQIVGAFVEFLRAKAQRISQEMSLA